VVTPRPPRLPVRSVPQRPALPLAPPSPLAASLNQMNVASYCLLRVGCHNHVLIGGWYWADGVRKSCRDARPEPAFTRTARPIRDNPDKPIAAARMLHPTRSPEHGRLGVRPVAAHAKWAGLRPQARPRHVTAKHQLLQTTSKAIRSMSIIDAYSASTCHAQRGGRSWPRHCSLPD
jgi:hypothetical protein